MIYLVSYDIPDTKRRTKVAKILKDFGDRVQYSVFECLIDPDLFKKMIRRLKRVAKVEQDNIRIYSICTSCEKTIEIIGQGDLTKEEKYYVL